MYRCNGADSVRATGFTGDRLQSKISGGGALQIVCLDVIYEQELWLNCQNWRWTATFVRSQNYINLFNTTTVTRGTIFYLKMQLFGCRPQWRSLQSDSGYGTPFWRAAIPKGSPFWKPSFMVVAWNSSWYCHNQTTDPNPNPNRIPNRRLSLLEMAENGRPFGMAAPRNGGPTPWLQSS